MPSPKGAKKADLTLKQQNFITFYANSKSETFANAVRSYVRAGYKDSHAAHASASILLTNPKIVKALAKFRPKEGEYYAKNKEISGQYADQQTILGIEGCKDSSGKIKDMTNFVALCRLLHQRCGQLSDRVVVDVKDSRELNESHRREAKRIASIIIESGALPDFDPVPGEQRQLAAGFNSVSEQFENPPEAQRHIPDVVGDADRNSHDIIDNDVNTDNQ